MTMCLILHTFTAGSMRCEPHLPAYAQQCVAAKVTKQVGRMWCQPHMHAHAGWTPKQESPLGASLIWCLTS